MSLLLKLVIPAIVIGVLATTANYAETQNVLPTNGLYPFKKIWELMTIQLSFTPADKAIVYLDQSRVRISEAKALTAQAKINPALSPFLANAVSDAVKSLAAAQVQVGQVTNSSKKQNLENQIAQTISDEETEITGDVLTQAQLQNDDRSKINRSKDQLDQIQGQISGS